MNRLTTLAFCALLSAGMALAGAAAAQSADEAIDAIKTYEFGDSRLPLIWVESMVVANMQESEAHAAALARMLAEVLHTEATPDAKRFVCRQLAVIGRAENVATIAPLLRDPQTADMARYAIEAIPGGASDRALLEALDETAGSLRIGIINSLGARRTGEAVRELAGLARGSDVPTAEAAIAALGKIGSAQAARQLTRVRRAVGAELQPAVDDATLVCAERLAGDGNVRRARSLYRSLERDSSERARKAAARGLAALE